MAIAAEQLKSDEGLRLKPYYCPAGKLTIGYGRNLEEGITQHEADLLLQSDVSRAVVDVVNVLGESCWDNLNDVRKAVVVNMMFNLGSPRFRGFVNFIEALQSHNYDVAADEMLDSLWSRQVPNRAKRLAEQMRQG